MFNDYQKERKSNGGKKAFIFLVLLVILGLTVWAVIHYVLKGENNITTIDHVAPVDDSARVKDSLAIYGTATDSMASLKNPADSFTFKIVVNEFGNMQAALTRLNNLKSYNRKVIMYTNDSVTFKIAEPFMRPLSDTTKVLDSLNRYYSKASTKIEY